MLTKFLGEEVIKGLYQTIYDETVDGIRKTDYSNSDGEESVSESGEDRVVKKMKNDKGKINPTTYIQGKVRKEKENRIDADISVVLPSSHVHDAEDACYQMMRYLLYGICRLEKELKMRIKSVLEDKLIDDKFLISVRGIRTTSWDIMEEPEYEDEESEDEESDDESKDIHHINILPLIVVYSLTIIEEKSSRPGELQYTEAEKRFSKLKNKK